MHIEIDCNVSIPHDAPRIVQRKRKAPAIPRALKNCVEAFQDAYKVVYGVTPEVSVRDGYIRIKGQDAGVTKVRLKEMTTQLKWRAG